MLVWTPSSYCGSHLAYSHSYPSHPRRRYPSIFTGTFNNYAAYEADDARSVAAYEYAAAQAPAGVLRRQQEEALYRQRLQEQALLRQQEEALCRQRQQELEVQRKMVRQAQLHRARSEGFQVCGPTLYGHPVRRGVSLEVDVELDFAEHARARAQEARRQREAELARHREWEQQAARARAERARLQDEEQRFVESLLGLLTDTSRQDLPPVSVEVRTDTMPNVTPTRTSVPDTVPAPEKKDKGKARETPAIPIPSSKADAASVSEVKPAEDVSSLRGEVKALLENRLLSDTDDAEVKEAISNLLGDIFGSDTAQKGVQFQEDQDKRCTADEQALRKKRSKESLNSTSADSASVATKDNTQSVLSAEIATEESVSSESSLDDNERRFSLGTIQRIEDSLRDLRAAFVFPESLDFAPSVLPKGSIAPPPTPEDSVEESNTTPTPEELAFSERNKPVRAYEHALNGLLSQLDAVASGGDAQIRGRRREVINKVEGALQEVEQRVRQASLERKAKAEAPSAEESIEEVLEEEVPTETPPSPVLTPSEPSVGTPTPEEASELPPAVESGVSTALPSPESSEEAEENDIEVSLPTVDVLQVSQEPTTALEEPAEVSEPVTAETSALPLVPSQPKGTSLDIVPESVQESQHVASKAALVETSQPASEPAPTLPDDATSSESVEPSEVDVDSLFPRPCSPGLGEVAVIDIVENVASSSSSTLEAKEAAESPIAARPEAVVEAATTEFDKVAAPTAITATSSTDLYPSADIASSPAFSRDLSSFASDSAKAEATSSSGSLLDVTPESVDVAIDANSAISEPSDTYSTETDAFLLQSPATSTSDRHTVSSEDEDMEIIHSHDVVAAEGASKHAVSDVEDWSDIETSSD